MRIGELARRSGVAEKTLRYYEDVGLIDKAERSGNGYRDYTEDVLDRLRFVRSAQAVGLTLAEIREVVALRERGKTPCKHVLDLIGRHAEEIDVRIKELQELREELHLLSARGRELDARNCSPQDICHVIPVRGTASSSPGRNRRSSFASPSRRRA